MIVLTQTITQMKSLSIERTVDAYEGMQPHNRQVEALASIMNVPHELYFKILTIHHKKETDENLQNTIAGNNTIIS